MIERVELAVVGAGPAGMEAAIAAAKAGVKVTLIDGYPRPGGQYFKQLPLAFCSEGDTPHDQVGQALLHHLEKTPARLFTDTIVWGAFPDPDDNGWLLTLYGLNAPQRLQAETLILATGAYDRPIPFPGWTLPGVMTAGAVQNLLKSQRLLPGRRFLLSGTGPLQLAVATQLVRAGADVVSVLEGTSLKVGQMIRHIPSLWGQWTRLREGWDYRLTLWRAGVPLRFGWSVVEARGNGKVEETVIARLDDRWRPILDTQETLSVDTLVIGYGFIPATQLSRLLGCEHTFNPAEGGYVPRRDELMQTSLPGVYAVGDGAGIGGVELSRVEGRIAGLAAARRLGWLTDSAFRTAIAQQKPTLTREWRFARMLNALFSPGPGLYTLATNDTFICRCEEVRLGEIQAAVTAGARSANEVKGLTRAGMGNCQGRICGELVARAIANALDANIASPEQIEAVGAFTPRPPIHPLLLSVLAEAADVTQNGKR